MKLTMYFDVYPGAKPENVFFHNAQQYSPLDKMDGTKRYLAEFEVPDPKPPGVDKEITIHLKEE